HRLDHLSAETLRSGVYQQAHSAFSDPDEFQAQSFAGGDSLRRRGGSQSQRLSRPDAEAQISERQERRLQLHRIAVVQKIESAAADLAERRRPFPDARAPSSLSALSGSACRENLRLRELPPAIQRRRAGDPALAALSRRR